MNVGIYARVSTHEQAENGYSIDEQIDRMQKYCDAMNWHVFKQYVDAGFTGANTERPALQSLIRDVTIGKLDKVLVYKLDRLSRSQRDTLMLIEDVFLANNVDFVSMNENFDTSTPFGRAMIGILAVFAQLEREQIKERMNMGKYARAKKGKFHGSGHLPVGYDYKDDELIQIPFEAMAIKEAFLMTEQGMSPYQIAKAFREKGYYHRFGKFSEQALRYMLRNKTYCGYIRFHDEWYKGEHEPIISEDLFNDVQKILEKRRADHDLFNRRNGKATSYLGGFLYCKRCGAKYFKNIKRDKKPDGKTYVYEMYSCHSRVKRLPKMVRNPECKNKHWKMDELDNLIFDQIKRLRLEDIQERSDPEPDASIVTDKIKQLNAQMEKLLDLYSQNNMPLDVLQNKITSLNEQKSALEQGLSSHTVKKPTISKENALKKANSLSGILEHGTYDDVRAVLTALIRKIELDGDDIYILWNF